MTPLYLEFGLPVEGIGLLIALDLIPDMFITAANVTANMTVACVLARRAGVGEGIVNAATGLPAEGSPARRHASELSPKATE